MPCSFQAFRRAALLILASAALWPATAGADAPDLGIRPPARPDPLAEWRQEQRDRAEARDAFERERREDWLDWQRDRGGTYNQWLRERREAERLLREERRKDWLEQQAPRPEAPALGQRLEEQWRLQERRLEDRTSEQRLRPDTLRRDRPGLRR